MAFLLLPSLSPQGFAQAVSSDVFIYGSTPGGIAAAVTAARRGCKVILAGPENFPGGMMAGGLTKTDLGNRSTVGGFPEEFFGLVLRHYTETYGADSVQVRQTNQGVFFEPKVAALIFRKMLSDAGVQTLFEQQLSAAEVAGGSLASVVLEATNHPAKTRVLAKVFIDASYEGDLMAAAGVPYRIGREGRDEYDESFAGQTKGLDLSVGKGDQRVQSYNIRSTLTNRPDLALPIPKPSHYDPETFRAAKEAVLSGASSNVRATVSRREILGRGQREVRSKQSRCRWA